MEEIVKHINDTNASYRALGAGDAKNTDLFLDNEHYELFKDAGEQITVRFNRENLTKAILFIASILPRKYDNSAIHKTINFSTAFVLDQIAFLDGFFTVDGVKADTRIQIWNARKDVLKANGEIDKRFYFNGLFEEIEYTNYKGERKSAKFTIRNYLAGGYSDLHIKKGNNGIFDIWITNTLEPYNDGKENGHEIQDTTMPNPLQRIFYGAPGTGKSNTIKREVDEKNKVNYRVTFHPDSDYSTFVGAYKPSMKPTGVTLASGEKEEVITYKFVPQAFTKAYIAAWNTEDDVYLIIEEINRGNCAQIFGDLFQLLDRGSDGVSEYPVDADSDLADLICKRLEKSCRTDFPNGVKEGKKLVLPSNLYIWATMNTSDQSLFPIDSAFKRRWDWQYMPIADGNKNWRIEVNGLLYDWWDFLEKINTQIGLTTNSEDKKLGYYFCKASNKVIDAKTFVGKVIFYLWNDVFKDYDLEGDLFKDDDNSKLTFDKFYAVQNCNTIISEGKVELFLKNLGVEPLEEEIIDEEESDDDSYDENNDSQSLRKSSNIEIYYDGSKIEGKNSIVKFANLIEMIGVENVAELGIMAIKKSSIALLSKTKLPEDTPGGYGKGMRQIGDYWMVVKYNNDAKINMINEIAEKLSLNIRAELIK